MKVNVDYIAYNIALYVMTDNEDYGLKYIKDYRIYADGKRQF